MVFLTNSNIVNLSILNQNNDLVWAEQVSVKDRWRIFNISYSWMVNGWENSGTYKILKLNDGTMKSNSIKFTFTFITFQILSNVNL